MDEPDAGAKPEELEPRPPLEADLAGLCRELNKRGAQYVVIGGFAIIAAGLPRVTGDIDLMVATDPENESKVFSALSTLPDNAARELQPGELQRYNLPVLPVQRSRSRFGRRSGGSAPLVTDSGGRAIPQD